MDDEILLREFVQGVLLEKAAGLKDAQLNNLALYFDNSSYKTCILYDSLKFIESFKNAITEANNLFNKDDPKRRTKKNDYFVFNNAKQDDLYKCIYAQITFSRAQDPAYGANTVRTASAKSGYGPLIYDIVMSLSDNGLMPDRGEVSSSAANVWKYYDKNRNDVRTFELDDIGDPQTPPKRDDSTIHDIKGKDYLDKVYQIKKPVATSQLVSQHTKNIHTIHELLKSNQITNFSIKDINEMLRFASGEFFDRKYKT